MSTFNSLSFVTFLPCTNKRCGRNQVSNKAGYTSDTFQRYQNCNYDRLRVDAVTRGPKTAAPSYHAIDSNPANKLFTDIFRNKLEVELGRPATVGGYEGVIEVVKALARRHTGRPEQLQAASERVLLSLFPSWLPPAFSALFSRPLPRFAIWINAVVTVAVTQWLMGPSKVAQDGSTVEIERCRYLEETGCVGICVNSCKAATESFFRKNMGLGLAIEPNLEDYSCKFQFGKDALDPTEDPMYQESCLSDCAMANKAEYRNKFRNVKLKTEYNLCDTQVNENLVEAA